MLLIYLHPIFSLLLTYLQPSPEQHILSAFIHFDDFRSTPSLLLCPPSTPQTMETQMEEWYKEVGQLQAQVATIPQQTQIKETVAERQVGIEARMVRLIEPLKERRRILLAAKEVHQVGRDLEDEIVSSTHLPSDTLTHTNRHISLFQLTMLQFFSIFRLLLWILSYVWSNIVPLASLILFTVSCNSLKNLTEGRGLAKDELTIS